MCDRRVNTKSDPVYQEQFLLKVGHAEGVPFADEVVEVQVDPAALARALGPRAVNSKGGVAIEASGLVRVVHCRARKGKRFEAGSP